MFAAALIVFREVLEAALVVSIVMAATQGLPHRGKWVSLGIGGGVAGAGIVAAMTGFLAGLFGGAGQDIVNATILFTAVGLIGWHVVWMNSHGRKMAVEMRTKAKSVAEGERHMSILAIVVGLAVLREGSEVVLILQGLWTTGSPIAMLGGGALGLIGGAATGVLMYLGFIALPIVQVFTMTNGILVLIAAGMAAHAANFLAQAGLLSSLGGRIWDTTGFLKDECPLGQILAALIGYIARPSGIEVLFYGMTILIVMALMFRAQKRELRGIAAAVLFACIGLSTTPANASAPPMTMAIDADNPSFGETDNARQGGVFGFTAGINKSGSMLGDMWGLRPWLGQYGLTFGLQETSEVFGNATGGIHQSADYDGLTQMLVQLDTQRAFGWYGGTFNMSALQIHGRNLSADNLGTLQTASGIESDRATRLWELWYQQKFLDQDRMDVKIGQQSLDQEFMTSQNSNYFINTMFGWPMVPSADMPGGGPAYPLSALGVRMRGKPTDYLTLMGGIYNGAPMGINSTNPDSQMANGTGMSFPLDGGALAIAEIQYAYPSLGSMVSADEPAPLSRTYKLGIWYDTENFADQEFDNTGVSLAANTGSPALMHHGDYGIYAVADQMLWHSDIIDDRTLNFFTRVMGTPQSNRNLIDFSLNAGVTLHEPIFGRDDDTLGIGMGYAHVSSRAAALDRDMTALGTYTPNQTGETYIEITYQYQVTPWWQIQPDFQYVFNPGAGTLNPNTNQRIANEAVFGIRTNILF